MINTHGTNVNPSLSRRRAVLEHGVVHRFIESEGVYIVPDEAGVGKTTNVSRGLLKTSERVFFAVERHDKALDLNDAYFHVKGRTQPINPLCILRLCDHEHERDCPRICPAYPNPTPRFKRLERIFSHREAHRRINEIETECPYLEAYNERENHDLIVGVHHQITEFNDRIVIIDETPTIDTFQEKWKTADLERASNVLRHIPDADWLADWVDSLRSNIATTDVVDIDLEPPEKDITAEQLARLKVDYNDHVVYFPLPSEPCFDAILGALTVVGFEPEACRAAIDGPTTLEYCPQCRAPTFDDNCPNCFWEKERFDILDNYRESYSRVTAYAVGDTLVFTKIPAVNDLPNHVMILDATARPSIVSALFGVDESEIIIEAPESDFEPNIYLTEIYDGQYHASTIASKRGKALRSKIQRTIDMVDRRHEHVLYAVKRSLEGMFDIPDRGNIVKNYHALRGMNIQDKFEASDDIAVCLIGAPHPDVRKLKHVVSALGHNANVEEFYEKRSVVVDGHEVNVETKAYHGLLGELFRSAREDELVQTIHRVRPILASKPIHVYKLTNVPTRLPVDERVTWNEFLFNGLHLAAVRKLVNPLCDTFDGDLAETSRSEIYGLVDASTPTEKRRIRRWMNRLEDAGICEHNGYAPDSSYRVVIDMASLREIA